MIRKKLFFGAAAFFAALSLSAQAPAWPEIETTARPGARWWWLGSAVDSANLAYNMEEYARAGMGTLEITPIYGVKNNEANDIDYLSPRWMQMLSFVIEEGDSVGLDIDMNGGTGWPFGGPEVSVEDAACKVIFQKYAVAGGEKPAAITVNDKKQADAAVLSRLMAYAASGKCLNITSRYDRKTGEVNWTAPAGDDWTLVAVFVGKTFQKVKRAAPGGAGYVMNHFSKEAVARYFSRFDKAFASSGAPVPKTFFNDSYEVYGADWTPDFFEQFARRRGYKLENHLLEFTGEQGDTRARLISDYRETIAELLKENFTNQWVAWAHKHGALTRNQAHGSPGNLIDLYASVDIPECEGFGITDFNIKGLRRDSVKKDNDSDFSMLKYASSGAHIAGKPYTSSETFTWLTEHFRTSLSQCKPDMDLMFAAGVNHMFFHGTPYSPREAEWPGWLFYATINMSPTNTIWRDAPAFFTYIARCQSFLQMGKSDNDFLVYLPVYDMWYEQQGSKLGLAFDIHGMAKRAPHFIGVVRQITDSGYDVDYISDNFVRTTVCRKDGLLQTSGGSAYKALILPAVKLMPENVLKHLLNLAEQGATLIFVDNYPQDVPGFASLEKRRKDFKKVLDRLPDAQGFASEQVVPYGKGRIITGADYARVLEMTGVPKEDIKTQYGAYFIRRSNDEGHHYFIASLQDKGVEGWITPAVDGESVAIYDPVSGRSGMAKTRRHDGRLQYYLQLRSGESAIVRIYDKPTDGDAWAYYERQPLSLSIDNGWSLSFVESTPAIEGAFDIDTLGSWTSLPVPEARVNSGTARYSVTFDLPAIAADEWLLDLGDVRESARVVINGEPVGTLWSVPFCTYVKKYLRQGTNTIEVEVTNLPANRIADYDRRGIEWRRFKDANINNLGYKTGLYDRWQLIPSGLLGTVRLVPLDRKTDF